MPPSQIRLEGLAMMDWMVQLQALLGQEQDWKQLLLTAMTPLFLLGFGVEWLAMRRRKRLEQFQGRDILVNLGLGAAYQVFELGAYALVTGGAAMWFYAHRLWTVPANGWTLLPIFLGVEFCYYWFHRCSHRVRWFWSAHVVHHSGERMNMTTAMRQSLLYSVTGWWLFFMPLVLLGVHPAVVFFLYGCDLGYQFFIHTESVGKLHPWIEFVFDTPSNHRAHHGRNPQYIDRNYGGVLIVFDRLFGTWVEEREAVDYGIPRQPRTRNLLKLNFHEFAEMWGEVLRPGPLGLRLQHLWAAPEWVRPAAGDAPAGDCREPSGAA
jgi:sterol desaturase/sphingolipid hydroxylase (fatty acid hydroxylase superfamily)